MSRQSRLRVQKTKRGRWVLLYICLVLLLATVLFQVDKRYHLFDSVQHLVDSSSPGKSESSSSRGTLFDRNLTPVAYTMERVAVFVRTREVDSITDTAIALSSVLNLDSNKLINQMESGALRLWVAEDISEEQEEKVKKLNLQGVHFQREKKRYYPGGSKAAHLIGFEEDGIGLSGIEYHYDRLLATRKIEQQKAQQPLSIVQDLVLTLDMKIQSIIEGLVEQLGQGSTGAKVGAYLMESISGEIIAGAQYPGFDPNSFTKYNRKAIENIFVEPVFLPDKFRLFLRDSANFYSIKDRELTPGKWAISSPGDSLGSQYRLWEWLKLGQELKTDFITPRGENIKISLNQLRVKEDSPQFGLIPEVTTPLNLLRAFSVLLSGTLEDNPFVINEVLDVETRQKVALSKHRAISEKQDEFPATPLPAVKRLFQGQALEKETASLYFKDNILTATPLPGNFYEFSFNEFCFVTIEGGERELHLLVVIKRPLIYPEQRGKGEREIEPVIDAKARRISILHQVAGSVEDVLEPGAIGDGNYPGIAVRTFGGTRTIAAAPEVLPRKLSVMPDLIGMSLRKSLRILQGVPLEITIEGTGRVIQQRPKAGTNLKKVQSCHLILERQDKMRPEIISKSIKKEK